MIEFDLAVIGAGIAAAGIAVGLSEMRTGSTLRVLALTGDALADPAVALSRLGTQDARDGWSRSEFGLPAVRAFGDGGTSAIWHGGLFVPHPDDLIQKTRITAEPDVFNCTAALAKLAASKAIEGHPIREALQATVELCQSNHRRTEQSKRWRRVLVPRRPVKISPRHISAAKRDWEFTPDAAAAIRPSRAGGWRIRTVSPNGLAEVGARHVVLAAGCLSSLPLMAGAAELPHTSYSDHLHLFAGVLSLRALPRSLVALLQIQGSPLQGHVCRSSWKTDVVTPSGVGMDISLTFRRVADPNFPRSGRSFGDFVGFRASGMLSKFALAARNPLTAMEMLAFKRGWELPFDALLIHATVAPRNATGRVGAELLEFKPDRADIAVGVAEAVSEFANEYGLELGRCCRLFAMDDLRASIISGAQFCAGDSQPQALLTLMSEHADTLHVADTAGFAFTSTQNQGILSLAHSYEVGKKLGDCI